MNYEYIKQKTLFVYEECNIREFPIDCINILKHYGFKLFTYNQLKTKNMELYKMCVSFSEDAFCYKELQIIAYDETKPYQRIRFSLMHELGHHILQHTGDLPENETEANYFASNMLAPRIAIHYAKCKNETDVSHIFGLSSFAAQIAFDDYKRWHRKAVYKINGLDKKMYEHFYRKYADKFVYQTNQCGNCGEEIINSSTKTCYKCAAKKIVKKSTFTYEPTNDLAFKRAENTWLYDNIY